MIVPRDTADQGALEISCLTSIFLFCLTSSLTLACLNLVSSVVLCKILESSNYKLLLLYTCFLFTINSDVIPSFLAMAVLSYLLQYKIKRSFTLGEGILISWLMLLFISYHLLYLDYPYPMFDIPFLTLSSFVICLVSCVIVENFYSNYSTWIYLLVELIFIFGAFQNDAETLIPYMMQKTSIGLIVYWSLCVILGLWIIHQIETHCRLRKIILRKLYHVLILMIIIPGYFIDNVITLFAIQIALQMLITIEIIRSGGRLEFITHFFSKFIDKRDEGDAILTHIYLLAGCGIPLYIDFFAGNGGALLGCVTVGIGDAAASIIGSTCGEYKLPNSDKTYEGTAASIILSILALLILNMISLPHICAVVAASLYEAYTEQIDNLVVPIFAYTSYMMIQRLFG